MASEASNTITEDLLLSRPEGHEFKDYLTELEEQLEQRKIEENVKLLGPFTSRQVSGTGEKNCPQRSV